jgi:flagellar capping protein FliD
MAGEFFYPNISGTFDWGTLLDGLMKIESVRLNKLKTKENFINTELKYYRELKSKLEDLYDFAADLNPHNWFNKKKVENLTPDIVDAQIVSNDIPEYTASGTVEQVATVEMDYFTKAYADPDKSFASQNDQVNDDDEFHLTLQYHSVNDDTVQKDIVFYGRDSLNDLIDKINNDPDIGKYLHAYAKYNGAVSYTHLTLPTIA